MAYHDVLEERSGHDHERLIDEMHDAVLDGDVGPHYPGHDHPSGMRPIANDGVGTNNDLCTDKN